MPINPVNALNLTTLKDAESQLSGFIDWEFEGAASFEGFCRYAREHHEDVTYRGFDEYGQANALMRNYLISVKQDPRAYSL